jgi:uroporphyrin-III C-methyltransferase
MQTGKVFIVGAGPGDPELITLRGVNALRQADVILYDRLAHPDLLLHARPEAERIYVGKERGQPGQAEINQLLIDRACGGQVVVRLKGGDPFVFGRGGEEALALSAAGIPFEVVPGVSAAVAVPEAALIPVTHRGTANAFAVFAGHEAGHGAAEPAAQAIDWVVAARIPTAVFLMGVERLPHIAGELLAHGRDASTPVAVIEQGTLPGQRVFTGTLHDIAAVAADAHAPATIVVGDVVAVRGLIQARIAQHEQSDTIFVTDFVREREVPDDNDHRAVDSAAWRQLSELIGR